MIKSSWTKIEKKEQRGKHDFSLSNVAETHRSEIDSYIVVSLLLVPLVSAASELAFRLDRYHPREILSNDTPS